MNTWVWTERAEARRCWWVCPLLRYVSMSLFEQLNPAASLCCLIAITFRQHVAAAQLEFGAGSPITLLSHDEKSNQKMSENWIRVKKCEEQAVRPSLCVCPVEPSGRFVPARWLWSISRQLLLPFPLLWSNPSLSNTVCFSDCYRSYSGDEAGGAGGSATSLITDLCDRKGAAGFIMYSNSCLYEIIKKENKQEQSGTCVFSILV